MSVTLSEEIIAKYVEFKYTNRLANIAIYIKCTLCIYWEKSTTHTLRLKCNIYIYI